MRAAAYERLLLQLRPPSKLRRLVFSGHDCADSNADDTTSDSDDSDTQRRPRARSNAGTSTVAPSGSATARAPAPVPTALLVFLRRVARTLAYLDLSHNGLSKDTLAGLGDIIRAIPPTAPLKEVNVEGNADLLSRVAVYKDFLQRLIVRKYGLRSCDCDRACCCCWPGRAQWLCLQTDVSTLVRPRHAKPPLKGIERVLVLSDTHFGRETCMAVNELLPALTNLEVHNSDVSVMSSELKEGLAVNTSLHTLDMTRNNMDDEGGWAWVRVPAVPRTLNVCRRHWVRSTTGAAHIAEGLARNATLRCLKLAENNISQEGVKRLRSMLVRSRVCKVKSFDLAETDETLKLVMRIRDEFASVSERALGVCAAVALVAHPCPTCGPVVGV